MANYDVKTIALDAVLDKSIVVSRGVAIADIGILQLSGGAAGHVFLQFGQRGPKIPLYLAGQNFHAEPAETEGVYLSSDQTLVGLTVTLLVGFSVRGDV